MTPARQARTHHPSPAACAAAVALALLALVSVASAPVASAQVGANEKAAAEALFDAGLSLMREGKYPAACDKLQQSQRIEPGIGTQLYLAECFAKIGRTASAWATFREAASAAAAQGQDGRAEAGARRADELEPLLSFLTVRVAEANRNLEGLRVKAGELSLSPQTWGVPIPMDPGTVSILAEAPGHLPLTVEVTVPQGGGKVEAEVSPLAAAPAEPASLSDATSADVALTASDPGDAGGLSGEQLAGLVTAGVGVVSVGLGAYFGLDAISKDSDADAECTPGCSPRGAQLGEDAQDSATLSTTFWIAGGALVAAGAVLYFVEPFGGDADRAQLSLFPVASVDGRRAGLVLQGGF